MQRICKVMTMAIRQFNIVFLGDRDFSDSLAKAWGSTKVIWISPSDCAVASADVRRTKQRNVAIGHPCSLTAEGISLNLSLRLSGLSLCVGRLDLAEILFGFLVPSILVHVSFSPRESEQKTT